ncbi:hypothetical protein [Solitalea canadensis]|uniref:Uncharacterized protein n=1 Tax=Solitalea canadensis (strain ATCC 29591 / DSM 3403 / JCM 21819 / LMG 8368 / NBRC 15130 / NCIMB 12057 / USAM 9D) TaxID=929556 RepID=H8KT58_SOLCM|nr:hypothetical protein [Solitalea canadensis]AFD05241.1 hypothetical protein Solca_0085 [Solitalea canadensis DSM 3403]
MKKLTYSLFAGILFSLIYVNSMSAQIKLPEVLVLGSSSKKTITEKVAKSFDGLFKGASDVKWVEADKCFVAKFIMDDLRNQAVFTPNGTLVYHLTYGFEKNLPKNVRTQVKSQYFDYNITSAIHISQDNRRIWLVSLADSQRLISVEVENGTMKEIANYINGGDKDALTKIVKYNQ